MFELSDAELRVLRMKADGMKGKEIAQACNRSEKTVRNQIFAATRKLGVRSVIDAVKKARQKGLIQ